MAKRKRRKSRGKHKRRVAYVGCRRIKLGRKKHAYKGKKRGSKRRKGSHRRKRGGAYAAFAKKMWRMHKAHYKSLGFKRAGKAIGAAWRKKKGK